MKHYFFMNTQKCLLPENNHENKHAENIVSLCLMLASKANIGHVQYQIPCPLQSIESVTIPIITPYNNQQALSILHLDTFSAHLQVFTKCSKSVRFYPYFGFQRTFPKHSLL